jgi:uncharacterized repeat protein (TIGR03943 family)
VRRDAQSVLVAALGAVVVRIAVDDTYLRYVKPWTRPWLVTAGAVLLLLGLVSLWRERERVSRAGAAGEVVGEADDHDDGHGHRHGPRIAWLLLLPIYTIFLVAPPALGSYTAADRPNQVAAPAAGDQADALPPGDPVTTTLTDYVSRAIWDRGRSLAGRHIRMVGFASPRKGGGFYLTRIVVTCCAADARPVKIAVLGGTGPPPAPDTWYAVTGTYGGMDRVAAADQIPVLRSDSMVAVPAPTEQYES